MSDHDTVRDRIVDTAIALGERDCWETVRLHEVASELGISLDEIRHHFREKEDIVDAWFDRADGAMLAEAERLAFAHLPTRARLHRLIMAWLDALAPHRRLTREMIHGKLEPGHLHIQIPGLLRVSRTVQWMREAAHRDASFVRRALEESGLTTIYLMSFVYWMYDSSEDAERTRRFLDDRLEMAESLNDWVFHGGGERCARRGVRATKDALHPSGNGPVP